MNQGLNAPYLRTSREFPEDPKELTLQIAKTYIDIAGAVNNRVISIFPTNRSMTTGESWFLINNQRQQSIRQVYNFGAIAPGGTLVFPHNIPNFTQFSVIRGTCITAIPDYRPIPYVSVNVANAEIQLVVSITDIGIVVGAASPAITSGIIILEWITNV